MKENSVRRTGSSKPRATPWVPPQQTFSSLKGWDAARRRVNVSAFQAEKIIGGLDPRALPWAKRSQSFGLKSLCVVLALALVGIPGLAQEARLDFLGKRADQWLIDLNSSDVRVRRSGTFALGQLGDEATSAVGPLTHLLQIDPSETVREAAAFSLGEICQGGRAISNETLSALEIGRAACRERV